MFIWPSILCSPPKGLRTLRYNKPSKTLRHHYAPKGGRSNHHQWESQSHSFKEGPKGKSKVCQSRDEGQIWILYDRSRGQGREMYWAGRIRSHIYWSPQWKHGCPCLSSALCSVRNTQSTCRELEARALTTENKSCCDFLIAHQVVLHQALQTLKDDLHSSYSLLLELYLLTPASQTGGWPLSIIPLKSGPEQSLPPKR